MRMRKNINRPRQEGICPETGEEPIWTKASR